ncbi:hypothetical protein IGI04_013030, partial [Brassica rapa subsp. trilocularis]
SRRNVAYGHVWASEWRERRGGFVTLRELSRVTMELVCESLGFKGKGICKVHGTVFVVICDRALPGERFLGCVTRRKGDKDQDFNSTRDLVEAPCEYASYCGGCKAQNLSYEAQLRAKDEQVHELITHIGRFSDNSPGLETVLKAIVPCDIQF